MFFFKVAYLFFFKYKNSLPVHVDVPALGELPVAQEAEAALQEGARGGRRDLLGLGAVDHEGGLADDLRRWLPGVALVGGLQHNTQPGHGGRTHCGWIFDLSLSQCHFLFVGEIFFSPSWKGRSPGPYKGGGERGVWGASKQLMGSTTWVPIGE